MVREASLSAMTEPRAALAELTEISSQIGEGELTQIEAATAAGSLFVVKDGTTMIAASTSAEPTAGLVFYDLKSCLRAVAKPAAKPKPKPKPKPRTTRPKG